MIIIRNYQLHILFVEITDFIKKKGTKDDPSFMPFMRNIYCMLFILDPPICRGSENAFGEKFCGLSGIVSSALQRNFCIRIPVPASQCAKTKLALYSLIVFSIRHTAEVDKCSSQACQAFFDFHFLARFHRYSLRHALMRVRIYSTPSSR